MTSIRRQSSEELTLFCQNFTPVTVVHHCIRHQCFILLPDVWVVFKIYFAILHKIVARNNIQQSIRLNKQKEKKKVFALLLHIRLGMLHIWVICFDRRDVVLCERCVVIFLKTVEGST